MSEIRIRVWIDGHEVELSPIFRDALEKKVSKAKGVRKPTRSFGLKPITGE